MNTRFARLGPWWRLAVPAVFLGMGGMAAAEAPSQAQIDAGKAVFMKQAAPTCATCHTLKDAGSTGNIGPDLDELKPSEQQIRAVLRDGSGAMPSFEGTLSKEQLDAVTAYVYWATRAQ